MRKCQEKIVVALSGGVDSAVAAVLLQLEGHAVFGVTFQLLEDGEQTARAARAVADRLGIGHRVVDCRAAFRERVLARAWAEYAAGRTPNPCVVCNPALKFQILLEQARDLGADQIATGHYASFVPGPGGYPLVRRGRDARKDQSYFLAGLGPQHLDRLRLPLGEYTKDEVRTVARERELPCASRPESQDVCFAVAGEPFAETLRRGFDAPARPGPIVDRAGRALGEHAGIHLFTVGQRHGLGLAVGRPAYVVAIRPERAEVVVSDQPEALLAGGLVAAGVRWAPGIEPGEALEAEVQIRHRSAPVRCRIEPQGGEGARLFFERPQRAVTPGQAAVFYQGAVVIGFGWIQEGKEVLP